MILICAMQLKEVDVKIKKPAIVAGSDIQAGQASGASIITG